MTDVALTYMVGMLCLGIAADPRVPQGVAVSLLVCGAGLLVALLGAVWVS